MNATLAMKSTAIGVALITVGTGLAAQTIGAPSKLDDGLEVAAPRVLKDGKLVFERYFGVGGPNVLNDTRFVAQWAGVTSCMFRAGSWLLWSRGSTITSEGCTSRPSVCWRISFSRR